MLGLDQLLRYFFQITQHSFKHFPDLFHLGAGLFQKRTLFGRMMALGPVLALAGRFVTEVRKVASVARTLKWGTALSPAVSILQAAIPGGYPAAAAAPSSAPSRSSQRRNSSCLGVRPAFWIWPALRRIMMSPGFAGNMSSLAGFILEITALLRIAGTILPRGSNGFVVVTGFFPWRHWLLLGVVAPVIFHGR